MLRKISRLENVTEKPPAEFELFPEDPDRLAETLYERKYSIISAQSQKKARSSLENGKAQKKQREALGPRDHYKLVQIMIFIQGLVHTLPMVFIGIANEYWMYKFRDPYSNSTDANDRTYLQANYTSLNHMISMGPSTICTFIIMFYAHKIRAKTRVLSTLFGYTVIFVIHTAFVKINTDDWQIVFFSITIIISILMSCTGALGSTANMTIVSQFPDSYMKTYLLGEGMAGIVTTGMRLISIVSTPTVVAGALIYFATGTAILAVSTVLFYVTTRLEYFRYNTTDLKESTKRRIPKFKEFKQVIRYTYQFLILHIISMLIPHAAIGALVVSEYYGTDSVWGKKYFVTCMTYILPSVSGVAGRFLYYLYEIDPPLKFLFPLYLTRELVITPLMYFVNAKPRKHLPVLFPHDWQYGLLVGTSSFSSGYIGNIMMLKQMRMVPTDKLELSWMVNAFIFKILGIITSPIGLFAVSLL